MRKKKIIVMFLCLLIMPNLVAENIKRETWEKVIAKQDYTENYKELKKNKNESHNQFTAPKQTKSIKVPFFLKILPLVLLVILLVFLVALFFLNFSGVAYIKRSRTKITSTEFEDPDQFTKDDLETYLSNAINNEDYRLAVRIHFLIIIKKLKENNFISWKKEKTNTDYLFEVNRRTFFDSFKILVNIFDRIWYADYSLSHDNYNRIALVFREVESKIGL